MAKSSEIVVMIKGMVDFFIRYAINQEIVIWRGEKIIGNAK